MEKIILYAVKKKVLTYIETGARKINSIKNTNFSNSIRKYTKSRIMSAETIFYLSKMKAICLNF